MRSMVAFLRIGRITGGIGMKEIIVKFDKLTGEAIIEANGFQGQSCDDAMEFLKILGDTKEERKKLEYFQASLELSGKGNTNLCG